MTGVVVVDTNLLMLLIVGTASKDYIRMHRRLNDYTVDDFDLLVEIIGQFSDMVFLPHILAEVSNFSRQIKNPARARVQDKLREFIMTVTELPIPSASGADRPEFTELGLTDATILHLCAMSVQGINPTLLTADTALANSAHSLGYSVIDYKQEFQDG